MELVEKYAPVTWLLRLKEKHYMRTAACYGHANVHQWLSRQLDGYLPVNILYSGLRRLELLTSERVILQSSRCECSELSGLLSWAQLQECMTKDGWGSVKVLQRKSVHSSQALF